jgi:hypothetical protein
LIPFKVKSSNKFNVSVSGMAQNVTLPSLFEPIQKMETQVAVIMGLKHYAIDIKDDCAVSLFSRMSII